MHEGTVDVVTTIDDYKRVGDILIAHTVKVSLDVKAMMAHGADQSVIIKSVDLNAEIEDARFKMPESTAGS